MTLFQEVSTETDSVDWTHPLTFWRVLENLWVTLLFLVLVGIPLAEMILRPTVHTGIASAPTLVQHLVLLISMFGGALAAREDRLLSISLAQYIPRENLQWLLRGFAYGVSAAVAAHLTAASWQFVRMSYSAGSKLAYGIPLWVVQASLVVGFALIALRLIWKGANSMWSRFLVFVFAGGVFAAPWLLHLPPTTVRPWAIGLVLVAALAGAPLFAVIGGLTWVFLWSQEVTVATIPLNHYSLTTSPTLPAIPLFTFAGYLLAYSNASARLVLVFQSWFGWFRGGPAVVTVLVCAFFTAFTGASGVTILALGGLLLPVLRSAGYSTQTAIGLLTASGSLGLLFPPCLPPILYSVVVSSHPTMSVRMEEMFLGGVLPGLLMLAMICAYGIWKAPPREVNEPGFEWRTALKALWIAKWELLTPVVALEAIFGGFATPMEAAALTAAYALFVEVVIHREISPFRGLLKVTTECGQLVGGVLLILGVALGFTYFLIDAQIPDHALRWVQAHIHSPWLFLLAVNGLLLVVGCLMDIYSAIVVVVPLLVPIAHAFEISPIHIGIVFLTNLELGYLTPPVGMNLFLAAYRFRRSIPEIIQATFPLLLLMALGVLLVTYLPWLSTWLPGIYR